MATGMSLNRRLNNSTSERGLAGNQRRRSEEAEDRPMSENWVNVGYYDMVDGEEIFVNLGGFPYDRLKEVNGNSPLSKAKRRLKHEAGSIFEVLEPGVEEEVPELVVRFRRNAPNENVAANDEAPRLSLRAGRRQIAAE